MGVHWDWATCLDCGKRRTVKHREWIRASRPRCLACGGPVEPSEAAKDDHRESLDAHARTKAKLKKQQGFK